MQRAIGLDKDKRTITVSATHFSVYSLIFRNKLSPAEATIRVGQSVKITHMHDCNPVRWLFGLITSDNCGGGAGFDSHDDDWKLAGEGTLTSHDWSSVVYTAPGKRPPYGRVTVMLYNRRLMLSVERPCTKQDPGFIDLKTGKVTIPSKCYKQVPGPTGTLQSVITIVDRGYRATGNDGALSYSGVICDLEKPFTVTGTQPDYVYTYKFSPSSATGGTGSFSGNVGGGGYLRGGGGYTVEGLDTGKPRIVWQGSVTGGAGPISRTNPNVRWNIDLVPLEGDECTSK